MNALKETRIKLALSHALDATCKIRLELDHDHDVLASGYIEAFSNHIHSVPPYKSSAVLPIPCKATSPTYGNCIRGGVGT